MTLHNKKNNFLVIDGINNSRKINHESIKESSLSCCFAQYYFSSLILFLLLFLALSTKQTAANSDFDNATTAAAMNS